MRYAEHIVRLTWNLNVLTSNYPVLEGQADLDFASTPVLCSFYVDARDDILYAFGL